jgi:2,4-dienoyl-CoA reductase-like NADH-dependent reductase (Old Yellow Enzyme family)
MDHGFAASASSLKFRLCIKLRSKEFCNSVRDQTRHHQYREVGLCYLHIIEPRVKGNVTIHKGQGPIAAEQLRKVFKGKIVAAGGFEPETAETAIESGVADAVAFGRHFAANPDLPVRIREGLALTPYDRDTVLHLRLSGL